MRVMKLAVCLGLVGMVGVGFAQTAPATTTPS